MRTAPEVGASSPARMCPRVVLPDPDGPVIATNSAGAMLSVTPARAVTGGGPGRCATRRPARPPGRCRWRAPRRPERWMGWSLACHRHQLAGAKGRPGDLDQPGVVVEQSGGDRDDTALRPVGLDRVPAALPRE